MFVRIDHRLTIASTPQIRRELAAIGVEISVEKGPVTFVVAETDPRWPAISTWCASRKPADFVSTSFTKSEVLKARWLEVVPARHYGYPQPDDVNPGFEDATYDLTDACTTCGAGRRQKAPFQMKGEPRWGRREILQLNWIFDEYFVTPRLWSSIFEPRGVMCRPVKNRRGVELRTVVQLVVDAVAPVLTTGLPGEPCIACGRFKYLPVTRGPFAPLAREPSVPIVRTDQCFGSGASAWNAILVSKDLAAAILSTNVKGIILKPSLDLALLPTE